MKHIRNFCIIAHIDHGKSTLADRLIQACGGVTQREFRDQMLDAMDIERERGITIKSNTITLAYRAPDGQDYLLNLIDTPGHVDFSHEVRRSLMACEGALMVVDASQGVEAQTVANLYLALEYDLELLPVINKIDLPSADVDRVREEIDAELGLDPFAAIPISAKKGVGIEDVLAGIVETLPSPQGDPAAPLKALVFDAHFDSYRGVILQCRVMEGTLKTRDTIHFMHSGRDYTVDELGYNQLKLNPKPQLSAGEVGYIVAGVKSVRDIEIGDTITLLDRQAAEPIPGYQKAKQVVFSSVYPMNSDEYKDLTKALDKLAINDAALTYEKDSSAALGFGFRCGFLGLLHLDVIQERLQREFDIGLVISAPSVKYKIALKDGHTIDVDNPSYWPDPSKIESASEPYIKASIMTPAEHVGPVMELCREHRSESQTMNYLSAGRVEVISEMPLGEVLFDFYSKLKTITRGYGSFDYVPIEYRDTDVVKVDILVNKEPVDTLSYLVHRDKARIRALHYCEQLAEAIPRHQFKIPIQGVIGGKIIARSTIQPYRKDVTAKLYGGDVTRKNKLLDKQKKGKAKMKQFGQVNIPQKAFVSVLRADQDSSRFAGSARDAAAGPENLEIREKRAKLPAHAARACDDTNREADVELIIHEREDISYVALEGRLDATGVEGIEKPFTEAITERGLPTVVDLSGISFMSSLGIGFLFAHTKRLKKAGCKLVLLNPKGMVEAVLRTSKMDKVMPIAYELDEALQILLGGKAAARATSSPTAEAAPRSETAATAPASIPDLKLAIKNEMSELKELYVKVEEFLAAHATPYRSGYTVNLALEELIVNVIRYAYMDFDEHLIDIDLSIVDDQLILVIEDDGRPFDPREGQMLNPHLEEPEVGGLGLILVLEMVDAMSYARVGEKNRIEVRIHKFAEGETGNVPAEELSEN